MGMHLLLADSRHIYRSGLRTVFARDSIVSTITEVTNSEDLENKLLSASFDFVIVHQSLITIISLLPKGRFAILASEPNKEMLLAAHNHNMRGYFLENPAEDVLCRVLHLSAGECSLDPAITPWLLGYLADSPFLSQTIAMLTPREQEIYALSGSGLTQAEIAHKLSIAKSTVKRHLANITSKLEIKRGMKRTLPPFDANHNGHQE